MWWLWVIGYFRALIFVIDASLFCEFNALFYIFSAFNLIIKERDIQRGLLNPFVFIFHWVLMWTFLKRCFFII